MSALYELIAIYAKISIIIGATLCFAAFCVTCLWWNSEEKKQLRHIRKKYRRKENIYSLRNPERPSTDLSENNQNTPPLPSRPSQRISRPRLPEPTQHLNRTANESIQGVGATSTNELENGIDEASVYDLCPIRTINNTNEQFGYNSSSEQLLNGEQFEQDNNDTARARLWQFPQSPDTLTTSIPILPNKVKKEARKLNIPEGTPFTNLAKEPKNNNSGSSSQYFKLNIDNQLVRIESENDIRSPNNINELPRAHKANTSPKIVENYSYPLSVNTNMLKELQIHVEHIENNEEDKEQVWYEVPRSHTPRPYKKPITEMPNEGNKSIDVIRNAERETLANLNQQRANDNLNYDNEFSHQNDTVLGNTFIPENHEDQFYYEFPRTQTPRTSPESYIKSPLNSPTKELQIINKLQTQDIYGNINNHDEVNTIGQQNETSKSDISLRELYYDIPRSHRARNPPITEKHPEAYQRIENTLKDAETNERPGIFFLNFDREAANNTSIIKDQYSQIVTKNKTRNKTAETLKISYSQSQETLLETKQSENGNLPLTRDYHASMEELHQKQCTPSGPLRPLAKKPKIIVPLKNQKTITEEEIRKRTDSNANSQKYVLKYAESNYSLHEQGNLQGQQLEPQDMAIYDVFPSSILARPHGKPTVEHRKVLGKYSPHGIEDDFRNKERTKYVDLEFEGQFIQNQGSNDSIPEYLAMTKDKALQQTESTNYVHEQEYNDDDSYSDSPPESLAITGNKVQPQRQSEMYVDMHFKQLSNHLRKYQAAVSDEECDGIYENVPVTDL